MYNHLVYMSLHDLLHGAGFKNLAAYFKKQADGELEHYAKFRQYLTERHAIAQAVSAEYVGVPGIPGIGDIATLFLTIESDTTIFINNIMAVAKQVGDEMTQSWLQWAVDEQVEEEDSAMQFLALSVDCGIADMELMYVNR